MMNRPRQRGFSLTETLLAVGTLAIGLLFIGGTFMTGIYFTTVSTERTIAAVVADEAFGKIRLYGLDPNVAGLKTAEFVRYDQIRAVPAEEFLYPSVPGAADSQYSWAAICKRMGSRSGLVQITVFVCRETGANRKYWARDSAGTALVQTDIPSPVRITVQQGATLGSNEVSIVDAVGNDGIDEFAFANDGAFLVDDVTGQIYRVLERYADRPDTIAVDRAWAGGAIPQGGRAVWVIPPAAASGRNPVAAVYQGVIRF